MTAENLTRTVREVPMERVYTQVDWTTLIAQRTAMRAAFEAEHGVPLTYMPFILRGMVVAARTQPRVNSRWTDEGPEIVAALNIGVAVSTDAGLQVPIIHHAEDWSLVGLARALHRIIPAAREGHLTISDIQGGTITVTNPGPFGTVRSAPIIPPGQSAILSVDSVREIPVVMDGALAIRSVATLGLTYDARLCDESDAISFLTTLQTWLEAASSPSDRNLRTRGSARTAPALPHHAYSVDSTIVTSARSRTSGSRVVPRPGAVGARMWPSSTVDDLGHEVRVGHPQVRPQRLLVDGVRRVDRQVDARRRA